MTVYVRFALKYGDCRDGVKGVYANKHAAVKDVAKELKTHPYFKNYSKEQRWKASELYVAEFDVNQDLP